MTPASMAGPIRVAIQPEVEVIGTIDGTNYYESGVWARAVVWTE